MSSDFVSGALISYFWKTAHSSSFEYASAWFFTFWYSVFCSSVAFASAIFASITSSSSLSARQKRFGSFESLTMKSLKRSTWPDVASTSCGMMHVSSTSSRFSSITKCFRQRSMRFCFTAAPGVKKPPTPP